MPCYYTGSAEGDARLEAEEANKLVTELTQMLCELCQAIEYDEVMKLPPKTAKWWRAHKKIDAHRKKQNGK